MQGYELPLLALDQPEVKVELLVQSSLTSRFYGDREPWFDVKLTSGGQPYHGAVATQPLSCLQAVEEGRRTALMCTGGVLAIQRRGEEVRVDYINATGSHLQALCQVQDFRALIESLSREG